MTTNFANDYHVGLDEYKTTVTRLFLELRKNYVDAWSIQNTDALILARFLEYYPRRVLALEIGTFVSVSAFHLTSQPKVSGVICADPNPTIAAEINEKSDTTSISVEPGPLEGLRVLDVVRVALEKFRAQESEVQLNVGVVGSAKIEVRENSLKSAEKIAVPRPPEGKSLLAFVDGLHTEEGVRSDLVKVFSAVPHAIAILDNCRPSWGREIRAGARSFMGSSSEKYRFEVLGESDEGLARSSLGVVYPEAEVERALEKAVGSLVRQPELLWLLRREEARGRIARLETSNSRMALHQNSRRYRLADTVAGIALRTPVLKRLLS